MKRSFLFLLFSAFFLFFISSCSGMTGLMEALDGDSDISKISSGKGNIQTEDPKPVKPDTDSGSDSKKNYEILDTESVTEDAANGILTIDGEELNSLLSSDESIKKTWCFFSDQSNWAETEVSLGGNYGTYVFNLPSSTEIFAGTDEYEWRAQVHLETDISLSKGDEWYYAVSILSTADLNNVTFKLCMPLKYTDSNGEEKEDEDTYVVLYDHSQTFEENVEKRLIFKGKWTGDEDINGMYIVFGFGGNPASGISISKMKFYVNQV